MKYYSQKDVMLNANLQANYPQWTKLSELLSDGLYKIIVGEDSPENVCQMIQSEMTVWVKEYLF